MTTDTRRFKSTEELAFANLSGTRRETRLEYQKHRAVKLLSEALGARWLTEEPETQRQINAAMEGAIADCRRPNPITALGPQATVRVGGAAPARSGPVEPSFRGTGWAKEVPIETPGGRTAMAAIDALADSYQPHGVGNKERREPRKKAEE
jgi:hypothetical protein